MPKVKCPNCQEIFEANTELPQMQCPNCGVTYANPFFDPSSQDQPLSRREQKAAAKEAKRQGADGAANRGAQPGKLSYEEVLQAIDIISSLLVKQDNRTSVKKYTDPQLGNAYCAEIVTSALAIDEMGLFCDALKKASAFKLHPLANGLIWLYVRFPNN